MATWDRSFSIGSEQTQTTMPTDVCTNLPCRFGQVSQLWFCHRSCDLLTRNSQVSVMQRHTTEHGTWKRRVVSFQRERETSVSSADPANEQYPPAPRRQAPWTFVLDKEERLTNDQTPVEDGSGTCMIGFAGNSVPRVTFISTLNRPKMPDVMFGMATGDFVAGFVLRRAVLCCFRDHDGAWEFKGRSDASLLMHRTTSSLLHCLFQPLPQHWVWFLAISPRRCAV